VTVTLANLDDVPQWFRIDALGISQWVEPGHSVSFALNAPSGQYVLTSYVDDPRGSGRPYQRLVWVLNVVDEGTPVGAG
jgi:hypothetical protein